MEVVWKVFSCEENWYWFEKQLQGKTKKRSQVPCQEKTELSIQQQKDKGDMVKGC